jgi:DNA-binding NtrC family response regulator
MQALDVALSRAADSELPVLFRGERGAGKGRAARRLHLLRHPAAPYLALAAATLGPEGPEQATLQLLQGGSLYLAGLEHLQPEAVQPLAQAMDGALGQGLHWMAGAPDGIPLPQALAQRLGALELRVPPLRERREDLLPLISHFLEWAAVREGRPTPWLEHGAERALFEHGWPGNVRELEVLAGRTLLFAEGHAIRHFPDLHLGEAVPMCLPWPPVGSLDAMLKALGREAEGQLLSRALREARGDLLLAAEGLGLTPRVMAQRLRDHGIPLEDGGWPLPKKAP